MHLVITRLCIAIFATANATEADWQVCTDFVAPVPYNVETCPGDVITWREKPGLAVCEITRDE